MKILITGAHFTPAQAVIEELKKDPRIEIVYVGRNKTMEGDNVPSVESQVLPKLGVKFIPITAGRLSLIPSIYSLISLFKIPIGFVQSFFILLKEKPVCLVSFGGYISLPLVFNAWILSIPIIIHEQTLVSGLSNTISSIFADRIAVSYEEDLKKFRGKSFLSGNPIRKEILNPQNISTEIKQTLELKDKKKLPLILIIGGNQGSHTINKTIEEILEELTKKIVIIHQTGDSKFRDFERLEEKKESLSTKQNYLVKKWISANDLGAIYKEVDLVISRAGANTLYELAYFGKPALVVPLANLYRNEQMENAKFFSQKGLVNILPQSKLSPELLLKKVKEMLGNLDSWSKSAARAKEVVKADASKILAQEIIILAEKNV